MKIIKDKELGILEAYKSIPSFYRKITLDEFKNDINEIREGKTSIGCWTCAYSNQICINKQLK